MCGCVSMDHRDICIERSFAKKLLTCSPVFLPARTSIRVVFPAPLTPMRQVRTPTTRKKQCSALDVTESSVCFHWQ